MTTPEAAAAATARAAPEPATNPAENGMLRCWCCGQLRPADRMIHLDSHPEVAVCLACAHFLHRHFGGELGPAVEPRRLERA